MRGTCLLIRHRRLYAKLQSELSTIGCNKQNIRTLRHIRWCRTAHYDVYTTQHSSSYCTQRRLYLLQ